MIEAEKEAAEVSIYEPVLVPGLFQTEECARLVFGTGLRVDKIEEPVAIRMERQSILADPKLLVFLLISEAVIRDIPPVVRPDQCKKFLKLAEQTNICVQVLPRVRSSFTRPAFRFSASTEGRAFGVLLGEIRAGWYDR